MNLLAIVIDHWGSPDFTWTITQLVYHQLMVLVCILQLENALQVVICKVKANRNIIFENRNNKTH